MADSAATPPYRVASLYRFVDLPDHLELCETLSEVAESNALLGTLILAPEGVNGTIAGSHEGVDALLDVLRRDPRFATLTTRESVSDQAPFGRLKIRVKPEIVTFNHSDGTPKERCGRHVPPEEWNDLLRDPDVLVIDTRNDYEIAIGTFRGSVSPSTDSFVDFPTYVDENLDPQRHQKIAMFCTGGVRCEKASSFLLARGFRDVAQLDGGILEYLKKVPSSSSLFDGECFVFDERVALNQELQPGSHTLCVACGHPVRFGETCPSCSTEDVASLSPNNTPNNSDQGSPTSLGEPAS